MDSNESEIKEEKILEYFHYSEFVNNELNITCNKNHIYNNYDNSSLNSSKIIEKYFINKRNISKINFDDLFTLLRCSIFFSMLRFHYENKMIPLPVTISNINYIDAIYSILLYEHISQYKYGLESKIMTNITESLLFQDYNQIIDEIMNNIMIEKQKGFNTKNKRIDFCLNNEYIPSKSINNKRIKLDNNNGGNNNIFNFNEYNESSSLFNDNMKLFNGNKNMEENIGCKLCDQINKLNIEHKKFLTDYLNKLNEFILKE
jgi:hypothetical protein